MIITTSNVSTLTLPSDDSKTIYVAIGHQMELIITYNNPYSVVWKCSSQWSVAPDTHDCSIKYTFTEDETTVYMIPTFETKQANISADLFAKRVVAQGTIVLLHNQ